MKGKTTRSKVWRHHCGTFWSSILLQGSQGDVLQQISIPLFDFGRHASLTCFDFAAIYIQYVLEDFPPRCLCCASLV